MTRFFGWILTFLVLLAGDTWSASSQSIANHSELQTALRLLDVWIEETVGQREQPGLSIGVVYDQDLIWAKGYGFADLENQVPATPRTLYRIASNSKLFTATAIMQLRDAGKLNLDDPVKKHLSWLNIQRTDSSGPPITIRNLLTHTSGLPREARGVHWVDLTFPTRQEMIRSLPDQTSPLPVNTEWKYSNLALSLAGEIVAAVSGQAWDVYVEQNIFTPLGMKLSRAVPRENEPGMAVGYSRKLPGQPRQVRPYVDIAAERPAGNIASCIEDLARFVSLQFRTDAQEQPVLAGLSLQEMHRVHWLLPDWKTAWGLGFRIERVDNDVRVGHGGSLPGYRTDIALSTARKLGVIVLTNAGDGMPTIYRDQAFKLLGRAVERARASTRESRPADPDFDRYTGTYTNAWGHVRIMVVDGELVMIDPTSKDPWETRVILEKKRDHLFHAVPNQWHYSLNGEDLRFEVNGQGDVTRLVGTSVYWERSD